MLPTDVEGFDALAELALDLRWSWNHAADKLWRKLDKELWDLTQNPWVVLQTVSREKLQSILDDPVFRKDVDDQLQAKRQSATEPAWFQKTYPESALKCVAYFSMEFMLSEALPIYSGGLGNVAGDQLKTASDLGVPVIGVGLLYQQGYFRQVIDSEGAQQAIFTYNDPGQLPITPLRLPNGEWLRLQLDLPGHPIWLRAWQVQVGKVNLYLLDSNDAANYPPYRGITSELYNNEPDLRLMQELVLGIGGWRLLKELGIEPQVCHLNEGHAALAVLERARNFMQASGQSFAAALAVTRAGNIFTTHTAVAAGFDHYTPALVEHCLGGYAENQLGISFQELLALGRQNPHDMSESFNMTYLAIRGSGAVNGVSRLHAEVSRQLFAPLFMHWPVYEVPVSHVTNGVHMPTWDSAEADDLWTEVGGKERWLGTMDNLEECICAISDDKLWKFRCAARKSLVDYTRERLSRQLASSGSPSAAVAEAKYLFDENILTIGFARRFASYKRPDLLLHDEERLLRLLNNPEHPMQLIIAGKAHPADQAGREMIRRWVQFIRRPEARTRVIFLSDYDMHLGEHLVQGVDIWLNTPRRPWEACGTSGMKVLVNGGINVSELDGWWAEAYTPEVGWALGDALEHGDDAAWDASEAEALYNLLERDVANEYYSRDAEGIPLAWVSRMRASMSQLTPVFSSNRAMREYTEQYYLPAASAYLERAANNGMVGLTMANWQHELAQKWASLRFAEIKIKTDTEQHVFEVHVYLNGLNPNSVVVELYAFDINNGTPERYAMTQLRELVGATGGFVYGVSVPVTRAAADYTARLIPHFDGAAVPLEANYILWQK
jgi:starch phosphorylase